MGRANVAAVCARWAQLPDRSWRLLAFMANLCRDDDPELVYYGGREALADVLGAPHTEPGFRRVENAVGHLVRSGAIVVKRRAGNGRNAEYRLRLFAGVAPHPVGGNPDSEEGSCPPSVGGQQVVDNGSCPPSGRGQPGDTAESCPPLNGGRSPSPDGGLSPPRDGGLKNYSNRTPTTQDQSPQVSTSPASSTASRPDPSPPPDQAAARPVATQPAFWPTAAPDPSADGEQRVGPGELRTRYAAARSRDRPA